MDFAIGQRVEQPLGTDSVWMVDALAELRQLRVGHVEIELELRSSGSALRGYLSEVERRPRDTGAVIVDTGVGTLAIGCENIRAFTPLAGEPLDRSDELR